MPNWCTNDGTISGSRDAILKFISDGLQVNDLPESEIIELMQTYKFSLASWLPMPKIFEDYDTTNYPEQFLEIVEQQRAEYGVVGWYDWRIKNYGCKWDCMFESFNLIIKEDIYTIYFLFDSPWCPPIAWFENMQKKYPEIDFTLEYLEYGCCFAGSGQTSRNDDEVVFDNVDYDNYEDSPMYEPSEDDEEEDEN